MHSKTTSPTTLSENYSVYQNIGKTVIYSNDCSTVSLTLSLNQYDHTLFPIPSSIIIQVNLWKKMHARIQNAEEMDKFVSSL